MFQGGGNFGIISFQNCENIKKWSKGLKIALFPRNIKIIISCVGGVDSCISDS